MNMLESLGGEAGCKKLAKEFYVRVAANPELKRLFPGKSLRCATEEFSAFLVQFLEGDEDQTQYRWWLSLRESHTRFKNSEHERSAWLKAMSDTIDSLDLTPETRASLHQFFDASSAYIIGNGEADINDPDLAVHWDFQRTLDLLIEALRKGKDSEATLLASRFVGRPSVLVGILAEFMLAGRPELVDYVQQTVNLNSHLATTKYNGRTLLHHAAGASCVLIVETLLAAGAASDTLDNGGHTPLYRVANRRDPINGALIARALIEAGANVNHEGGVNRSTPLHQAARHGNLEVARELITAGADTSVRDKNGFTPLDRAINCRNHQLVALLS